MEFDRFSIVLLKLRSDAPRLDESAENELQDAHMAFLSDLHDSGKLLAAGPFLGAADRELRGLSIMLVPAAEAFALKQNDPAVRAGRYEVQAVDWILPIGALSDPSVHLPRSIKEAAG